MVPVKRFRSFVTSWLFRRYSGFDRLPDEGGLRMFAVNGEPSGLVPFRSTFGSMKRMPKNSEPSLVWSALDRP